MDSGGSIRGTGRLAGSDPLALYRGRVPGADRLSPTSAALVEASASFVAIGGGDVTRDEMLAARQAGKPVMFIPADMNHEIAREKARKKGEPEPTDFRGSAHALLSTAASNTRSEELTHHGIAPLKPIPSEQWIERVSGDFEKPGVPFVIRIHLDAGLITLPHTHPEDENITVVQGRWWLGTGRNYARSALEPMELGAYGFVPKKMAHFAWSDTETILQLHGIGPFRSDLIDPSYVLTENGVLLQTVLMQPGRAAHSSPPECFALKVGARVRGDSGEGDVMGARCSPANQLTQYWVRKASGERFWATLEELKLN